MVSEQFDRCHGILLQYAEFLSSALTPATYVQLIPPLEDLIYKYHIEPEVIHSCLMQSIFFLMCEQISLFETRDLSKHLSTLFYSRLLFLYTAP
jgi:hypothetical protein